MKNAGHTKKQKGIIKMVDEKHIGERVYVFSDSDGNLIDDSGIIVDVDLIDGKKIISIEFDNFHDEFHDCDGLAEYGRGWFVDEDRIRFSKSLERNKYDSLKDVLKAAEEQASAGKGLERHANDNKYEDQVICVVGRLLKDHPFGAHAYQVIKKTIEAGRLYKIKGAEAAYQEMLGSINYAAAMCILIKEEMK